ncbi:aminotransferase class I/II-fold pyridoxal phosphate-dependent enzyme [Nitrospirillum sp. BR 11164]|uniref:pyridoxal phosphate-dependent aminotransferase n=1 Tax=Nitrospirillum sp. BR 11164 TaxID=3104324 RepID=UPI002AFDE7A4|nr:aminotransferase class I/II-fold pyridoxal phosphate-dependent enzyme [Nitrospirillum sp. BR 11164]MEA1652993.1 aminotransferase class I/II-fold pyridoxal phosphate-dependent enzyme [Nitrospirillum sp. BR 11164]
MRPAVAIRASTISPFMVMEVLRAANARQAAGGDVLHLEIGQPSTPAPKGVIAAAAHALAADRLAYTDALGLPALREGIARWYQDRHGVVISPRRVVVTTGSSGAFLLAFLAAFDPGDRVALAAPGYPAYRNILKTAGLVPVELPTGPETRFQPTPALLDDLLAQGGGPIRGLIVASPSNPTGTMLDPAAMAALGDWCRRHGVWLISDEIYHGIEYGTVPAATALAVDGGEGAITVNSFSKYFSMTGWRLGWAVVPERLVRAVECLAQNLYISPPTLSQHAAAAAFDCVEELEGHVARYRRNRDILLDLLPAAGFGKLAPADGAFFIYADISDRTDDAQAFCTHLLNETGVALTPGVDFDPLRGHHTVRISFAGAEAEMVEAARRLKAWRG